MLQVGQMGCRCVKCVKWGARRASALQVGCKLVKWTKWAASGPGRASVPPVGQVRCKWVKWAASGNPIVPPEKSPSKCLLCGGDCCDFQAFYSLLSAGDPPDPSDSLRTAFAGLPPHAKSPSNSIDFEGDFGEVDSGLYSHCNTFDPLAMHSTLLAHLKHTCPTWPTRNTFDTLGPLAAHLPRLAHSQHTRHTCTTLAPLDLGRLRQLGREWIECGKGVASASSVSQVRRKWVKCVASGSGVLQKQVCQVGQVCCKWGKG